MMKAELAPHRVAVQPAGAFVSEVVPPQIDALQLLSVPFLASRTGR